MRISLSTPQAYEFACHSKACAPPPTGKGGSGGGSPWRKGASMPDGGYKKGGPEPYIVRQYGRKQTDVTRDGTIAVTRGGGKLPRFRMRDNKSSRWVADKKTTRSAAIRVRQQTTGWM